MNKNDLYKTYWINNTIEWWFSLPLWLQVIIPLILWFITFIIIEYIK